MAASVGVQNAARDVAAAVVVSGVSAAMRTVALIGSLLTAVMVVDVVRTTRGVEISLALMVAPVVVMMLLAGLLLLAPFVMRLGKHGIVAVTVDDHRHAA